MPQSLHLPLQTKRFPYPSQKSLEQRKEMMTFDKCHHLFPLFISSLCSTADYKILLIWYFEVYIAPPLKI